MNGEERKKEIDELVKATEKAREELKKTWKKVEDLDATIQAARSDQQRRMQSRKSRA